MKRGQEIQKEREYEKINKTKCTRKEKKQHKRIHNPPRPLASGCVEAACKQTLFKTFTLSSVGFYKSKDPKQKCNLIKCWLLKSNKP